MTADRRAALRVVVEALPSGTTMPVVREDLLELLGNGDGREAPVPAVPIAPEELLTVPEGAKRLRVSVAYIYAHADRLPFIVRIGRKVRVSPSRLARYMERRS